MSSWADRIKLRMKELGLTQEELAQQLGITRGAITHYLAGRRVPPLNQFQKLATVLHADPAWLQYGVTNEAASTHDRVHRAETKKHTHYPIRILTWKQATECQNVTQLKKITLTHYIQHYYTDQPHWYALPVNGDSMVSSNSSKSFYNGDLIIIDPEKKAVNGDFIIAVLPRSKEATFKQYVIDSGVTYLKSLNSLYPLIPINNKTKILGVVVNCIS